MRNKEHRDGRFFIGLCTLKKLRSLVLKGLYGLENGPHHLSIIQRTSLTAWRT